MNPIDALESVLCDPDGKCGIHGSQEDRNIVETALAELREALKVAQEELKNASVAAIAEALEVNTLQAKLSKLQAQEPVAVVAEVHMSRYTLEWVSSPVEEGALLFAAPVAAAQPVNELVEALKKLVKAETRMANLSPFAVRFDKESAEFQLFHAVQFANDVLDKLTVARCTDERMCSSCFSGQGVWLDSKPWPKTCKKCGQKLPDNVGDKQ